MIGQEHVRDCKSASHWQLTISSSLVDVWLHGSLEVLGAEVGTSGEEELDVLLGSVQNRWDLGHGGSGWMSKVASSSRKRESREEPIQEAGCHPRRFSSAAPATRRPARRGSLLLFASSSYGTQAADQIT